MGIVGVIAAAGFVILFESQSIKNKWNRKEKIVFFVSLFLGTSLSIAWAAGVELLNPLKVVETLFRPITEPITTYITQFK